MSLRIRLVLFITLAVSLSMALVFWLSWERVGVQMTRQLGRDVLRIMDSEEDIVEVDAGNSFDQAMEAIARVRMQMVLMARTSLGLEPGHLDFDGTEGTMRTGSGESAGIVADGANNKLVRLFPGLITAAGLNKDGSPRIEIHRLEIGSLLGGGLSHLGLQADTQDLDGSTLARRLLRIPAEGTFFQTELSRESGFGQSLVFLLPVPGDGVVREPVREHMEIVVVALSLYQLEEDRSEARNRLLLKTYQHFLAQKRLDARISILDKRGTVLATTSHDPMPVPDNLSSRLRRNGHEEYLALIVEDGDRELALFKSIQPLGWIVQMQVPVSTVTTPVRAAFVRLGFLTALALLLVLAASLWSLGRTLRPLNSLIQKTRQLARLDLSSGDALSALERNISAGLDVNRKDEIGMLARAYVGMGKALGENIRELMRETSWRERMAGEISSASRIQRHMLPGREALARETNGRLAVFLETARVVGGDLFDVFTLADGRRALVVGDVSDKGVPAALFMAMVVTLVHQACRFGPTGNRLNPAEVMEQINNLLEERNSDNMFVTLFLGFHDDETGEFVYANGGHCPPLVVAADGRTRFLRETSGPVVGIMPGLDYRPVTTRLERGDRLVLYTDGVTEARSPDGDFFGETRLECASQNLPTLSPEEGLNAILEAVQCFQGEAEQADDLTLLVYECPHDNGQDHGQDHGQEQEASVSGRSNERNNGAREAEKTGDEAWPT